MLSPSRGSFDYHSSPRSQRSVASAGGGTSGGRRGAIELAPAAFRLFGGLAVGPAAEQRTRAPPFRLPVLCAQRGPADAPPAAASGCAGAGSPRRAAAGGGVAAATAEAGSTLFVFALEDLLGRFPDAHTLYGPALTLGPQYANASQSRPRTVLRGERHRVSFAVLAEDVVRLPCNTGAVRVLWCQLTTPEVAGSP